MNFADWNQGLLLSAMLIVPGGMLLIGASSVRERLMAIGTLSQAVIMALVTNGAFHGRSDLSLAAIVLAGLLVLWSLLISHRQGEIKHGDAAPAGTVASTAEER